MFSFVFFVCLLVLALVEVEVHLGDTVLVLLHYSFYTFF
jgi:hypothetical protein